MEILEKTYTVYEDDQTVIIELEDLRDNYIYDDALGKMGQLIISTYGVIINAYFDPHELDIGPKRSEKLLESFEEIFGIKEYNPLSGEYYNQILNIISSGKLDILGYINKDKLEEENYIDKKRRH